MSLRGPEDKAIHWAEALGLSTIVHVGAAYLLFNVAIDLDGLVPEPEPERNDLLITSLVLDSNALISATSQTAGEEDADALDPANERNDGAAVEPETLDPVTPEDELAEAIEPVEPLEEVVPDVEDPSNGIEPEALAEVAAEIPEAVAPVDPIEQAAAVIEEPETLDGTDALAPVEPELVPEEIAPVEQASNLTPEPLSPLRPQAQTLAPAATSTLTNTASRLTAVAPTALQPERVVPRSTGIGTISTQEASAAAARPAAPTRSLPTVAPPAPGTPEAVVSELVNRIRANVSDTCLIAIPQQAANGAPELVIVTASEADVAPYAEAILDGVEPRPGQRSVLVDARQCAVLDYVRQNRSYPAFRMSFGLAQDQIASGDQLVGAVGQTAGRYVSLILVDDNGVVQDLGQYLSFAGDEARFDVPLRRAGSSRDTKQLLVAIGTNVRPTSVDTQNGQLAADYFTALTDGVGNNVPIVMLPFDVR